MNVIALRRCVQPLVDAKIKLPFTKELYCENYNSSTVVAGS